MPHLMIHPYFLLAVITLAFCACDSGSDPVDPSDETQGTCRAVIDENPNPFEATTARVAFDTLNTSRVILSIQCESQPQGTFEPQGITLELEIEDIGPGVYELDGDFKSGSFAFYTRDRTSTFTSMLTDDEEVGRVNLTTFTEDRAAGTFHFAVPGLDGGPVIRVEDGSFDVPIQIQ